MGDRQGTGSATAGPASDLVWALLNATGEGIYGVDLEGRCTFANPFCVSALGYATDGDLLGRNMHDLIHHTKVNGEPYPVEDCRIYQAFRDEIGTHVEDEIVWRADGTSFPAEYWSYPVYLDGGLVGSVVAFVDITERRKVEEELRQREKLAALGKLSAGLAHELNNPAAAAQRAASQLVAELDGLERATCALSQLGVGDAQWDALREFRRELQTPGDALSPIERADREEIVAAWMEERDVADAWALAAELVNLDLDRFAALDETLPAGAAAPALHWLSLSTASRQLAETVDSAAASIADLVGAVKSYSAMDRAPVQELDVHESLETTLRVLAHRTRNGPRIVRHFDRTLPRVTMPAGELSQVWSNLLDNAIDAAGSEGEVQVVTSRAGDVDIAVEVIDDGPGIPNAMQARIFDPFFTTKAVGQGTGLGLDIVRRIVHERCDGDVNVDSRPGRTAFRVRLPLQLGAKQATPQSREV